MGINDYPQNVNDKMTMTIYDMVDWFRYASTLPSLSLHSAFALGSLCLRSYGGGKVNPKRDETPLTLTYLFVG